MEPDKTVVSMVRGKNICVTLIENYKDGKTARCLVARIKHDGLKSILVVNPDVIVEGSPLVSLCKAFPKEKRGVIDEYHRIVGKLCGKDFGSRYFAGPWTSDHMTNGRPSSFKVPGLTPKEVIEEHVSILMQFVEEQGTLLNTEE